MPVRTAQFIEDSVITIRNLLRDNLTDPITRSGDEQFIMTQYPTRAVKYPIITVRCRPLDMTSLGNRSEAMDATLIFEVQVWARKEKEKDNLVQAVLDQLRDEQFTATTGTVANGLYDFAFRSSSMVDEEGIEGLRRAILEVSYRVILE